MNSLSTKPTVSDSLVEKGDLFSAVVLYEDVATRQRAMQICDRLVQKFWADVEFDFSWWRFDFLHDSALAGDAVRLAARSELSLLAAHAGRELPPPRMRDASNAHCMPEHSLTVYPRCAMPLMQAAPWAWQRAPREGHVRFPRRRRPRPGRP